MAVTSALTTLGRLIRRTPPPEADVLEAYAHEVIPVLDRAEWLYQYWLEQSTLFTDSEKLGNVAAIHRWETATMGRSLEQVRPPSVLARAHDGVIDALELASRAAQLLSNGSRFHNANAVCEGQALLSASRERRLVALRAMRRYLLNIPVTRPDTSAADCEATAAETTAATTDATTVMTADVNGAATPEPRLSAPVAGPAEHPEDRPEDRPENHQGQDERSDEHQDEPLAAAPADHLDGLPAFLAEAAASKAVTPAPAPAAPAPEPPVPQSRVPATRSGWGTLFGRPAEPPQD